LYLTKETFKAAIKEQSKPKQRFHFKEQEEPRGGTGLLRHKHIGITNTRAYCLYNWTKKAVVE
jgi:hypothetical protein